MIIFNKGKYEFHYIIEFYAGQEHFSHEATLVLSRILKRETSPISTSLSVSTKNMESNFNIQHTTGLFDIFGFQLK